MTTTEKIIKQAELLGNKADAAQAQRFFKTGPGQYGAGDRFLGLRVPVVRQLAKEHRAIALDDALNLLQSPWHEIRLLALLIMVLQYKRGGNEPAIFRAYLDNTHRINNWDLVDVTAEHIVGAHLFAQTHRLPGIPGKPVLQETSESEESSATQTHRLPGILGKPVLQETSESAEPFTVLTELAKSNSLWERRIAIISTFYFIRRNQFEGTLALADLLLTDKEDLMHKAVGWMLREVGKRNQAVEEAFLLPRYNRMPRTMLRYAIERFPEPVRLAYLKNRCGTNGLG